MGWNREMIRAERIKALSALEAASRDDLLSRIVDLETALYPFARCLGALGDCSWRGTTATSKLFPLLDEDTDQFQVYVGNGKSELAGRDIPENKMHEIPYYEVDSITIIDGEKLHDDFEILAVHQSAPGAYVGCGSISMGDVRFAKKALAPPPPIQSVDQNQGEG